MQQLSLVRYPWQSSRIALPQDWGMRGEAVLMESGKNQSWGEVVTCRDSPHTGSSRKKASKNIHLSHSLSDFLQMPPIGQILLEVGGQGTQVMQRAEVSFSGY